MPSDAVGTICKVGWPKVDSTTTNGLRAGVGKTDGRWKEVNRRGEEGLQLFRRVQVVRPLPLGEDRPVRDREVRQVASQHDRQGEQVAVPQSTAA
jgi:hypothetical protein